MVKLHMSDDKMERLTGHLGFGSIPRGIVGLRDQMLESNDPVTCD